MSKKVSDFKVLDQIAEEGNPDGIAIFPTVVSWNKTKQGGLIQFGIPPVGFDWLLSDSHIWVAYAIKKTDFERVKKQLEDEQI